MHSRPMLRVKSILLPGVLILLTLAAYFPALSGGYIWDDDYYVTHNNNLRSAEGLKAIWFQPSSMPQYYPLVHTTFWLEYRLWGLWPAGYHFVNILLHAFNAWLLWWVLKRLEIPGAVFAAFIFALHPVHVESVAWVTERKNVLSLLFYLLAFGAYLRFAPPDEGSAPSKPEWRFYLLSLVFFLCALFSKTVTCSLPAALLLTVWWKKGHLKRSDFVPVAPMFVIGLVLAAATIWIEKNHVGARGMDWSLSFMDRCLIAGRALWFYAAKLLWPAQLTFIYPRWIIDSKVWWQYLYPSAALLVVAALFLGRHRLGRAPLTAVLFFAGSLFPALGFFDVYPMLYSFVADHFQYLASLGLIVGFASLASIGCSRIFSPTQQPAVRIAGAIPVLILGAITFQQSAIYRDVELLWRDTIAKNPGCWMAYDNLGVVFVQQEKIDEALTCYRESLRLRPGDADTLHDYGTALAKKGRHAEAIVELKASLEIRPGFYEARYNLGLSYFALQQFREAEPQIIEAIRMKGNDAEPYYILAQISSHLGKAQQAVENYRQALQWKPDWIEAQNDLAWLLATSEDPNVLNGAEALRLALIVCNATGYQDMNYLDTLAAANAEIGNFGEAVRIGQLVCDLATRSSLPHSVLDSYQQRLDTYRRKLPYRDRQNVISP